MHKIDSNHTCLAVISLDSALKKGINYYLQVFLMSANTLEKVIWHITDYFGNSSYSDESYEEYIRINSIL